MAGERLMPRVAQCGSRRSEVRQTATGGAANCVDRRTDVGVNWGPQGKLGKEVTHNLKAQKATNNMDSANAYAVMNILSVSCTGSRVA